MKRDDRHIIKEVLNGKSREFEHILNKYSQQVFNLVVNIVSSKEDAEELTQDVFLKAFQSLSLFKEESSFSTWLYRIATNTAISAARKNRHDTIHLDDAAYSNIPDELLDETLSDDSELQLQQLSNAIEQLTTDERAIITLYYINEIPIAEIASIMKLTASNVKTRLHRTRKKLYHRLNS